MIERPRGPLVIVGHSGFIGSAVETRLRETVPDLVIEGLSPRNFDLTNPASIKTREALFTPQTTVLMCAGVKRQLGDSREVFARNIELITAFAEIVSRNPVARIVYLSSAAVYGEDVENLAINENTPTTIRSYYGMAKLASEFLLQKAVVEGGERTELLLLRPATIYGPNDLETSYGPSGFLNTTVKGGEIVLWGDGSEQRELIHIRDLVTVICAMLFADQEGVLNVAFGKSYTFADALDAIREVTGRKPHTTSRKRSKPKVDNCFDASLLHRLLPDMKVTSLVEGVGDMFEKRYGGKLAP